MNASNNFTVVGFICKDAEVRNFEKNSPTYIHVYPSTSPRKERIPLTSFHPGLRDPSPQKPATPRSPQEGQAKGGLPITKETCHKDGKGLPPSKTKPPFFRK